MTSETNNRPPFTKLELTVTELYLRNLQMTNQLATLINENEAAPNIERLKKTFDKMGVLMADLETLTPAKS